MSHSCNKQYFLLLRLSKNQRGERSYQAKLALVAIDEAHCISEWLVYLHWCLQSSESHVILLHKFW